MHDASMHAMVSKNGLFHRETPLNLLSERQIVGIETNFGSASKRNSLLKRVLETVGGIALFVGLILVYNAWSWLSEGSPTIPQLEGRWWAGYYETTPLERQWCVARFIKATSGRLQMALLSPSGAPDIFDVERSSSSETFVYLTFTGLKPSIRIDAKQLYAGKRYYWGRLMNGRFLDFWKTNEDITIRGQFVSTSPQHEFAIEPIGDDQLEGFWKRYVRPDQPTPSPADILKAAGVMALAGPHEDSVSANDRGDDATAMRQNSLLR